MRTYPIYIHFGDNGSASGFFPSVKGCFFSGKNIEECIKDAKSSLAAHVELLLSTGGSVPLPANISHHTCDEDCKDGVWFLLEVEDGFFDKKVSRINITINHGLLDEIDEAVAQNKELYHSRSGFFSYLAKKALDPK